MIKLFWQTLKVAPILFAASLFAASGASAQSVTDEDQGVDKTLEQINNYQNLGQDQPLSQVTNVNQLRDVSPTDWAYEALRSLVDRYGCIAGYPNQTYRGDQPLTRYEFAAGLNSCLNQIERLIASQGSVSQEDLDTINRLQQEFEAELATLGGRVDELESRTATLEDNQFSTTTKLNAEAVFAVTDTFNGGFSAENLAQTALNNDNLSDADIQNFVGDVNADGVVDNTDVDDFNDNNDINDETAFSDRVRLNFDSSFYGKDRLRARLEAGNVPNYGDVTGTDSARLNFEANNGNDIELSKLYYIFPLPFLNNRITGYVGTTGMGVDDVFDPGNPTLENSGDGALARFNRYNPLIYRATAGAGAGVTLDLIPDKIAVTGLYVTDNASDPTNGQGLFNGSYSTGGQIDFTPFEGLQLGASYLRGFQTADSVNLTGSTGSPLAANPFNALNGGIGLSTTSNTYGLNASYNLGEKIVLGGFGGYSTVSGLAPGNDNNPSGELWTWQGSVSFLDLVKEGSQLAFAGGQVPRFSPTDGDAAAAGVVGDIDRSYLVEAQYKFPLNDNISITPGAYAIFNANGNNDNDTIYAGVLRGYFKF